MLSSSASAVKGTDSSGRTPAAIRRSVGIGLASSGPKNESGGATGSAEGGVVDVVIGSPIKVQGANFLMAYSNIKI